MVLLGNFQKKRASVRKTYFSKVVRITGNDYRLRCWKQRTLQGFEYLKPILGTASCEKLWKMWAC